MGKSVWRSMVSCVLLILFPGSMFAADSNAAMLYTNGAAWVNGAHVPHSSSAIFSGDLLQTRSRFRRQYQSVGFEHHRPVRLSGAVRRRVGGHSTRQRDGIDLEGHCGHGRRCQSDAGFERLDGIQCHRRGRNGQDRTRSKGDLTINDGKRCGYAGARPGYDPRRDLGSRKFQARKKIRSSRWSGPSGGGRNHEFSVRDRNRGGGHRRRDDLGAGEERQSGQPDQTVGGRDTFTKLSLESAKAGLSLRSCSFARFGALPSHMSPTAYARGLNSLRGFRRTEIRMPSDLAGCLCG